MRKKEDDLRNCERCTRKGLFRKTGRWVTEDGVKRRMMRCRCGHYQLEEPPQKWIIKPKVLYLDIETSTVEMRLSVFDRRLRSGWLDWRDIEKSFYVICWAAAWVTEEEPCVFSGACTGWEARRRKDKRCLSKLWELIDRADIVVGHNSRLFDIKKLETRFMLNAMGTPTEYRQFDTLAFARKRFKSESNALEYWSRLLGGNPKDEMAKEDWEECNKGNQKIINKMRKYNRGDVREGIHILKRFIRHAESNGAVVFR